MAQPTSDRDALAAAIHELRLATECRCCTPWTERGMHETHCIAYLRDDVELLAAHASPGPVSEPLHEWVCPNCGHTTRARMADHPAPDDHDAPPSGRGEGKAP